MTFVQLQIHDLMGDQMRNTLFIQKDGNEEAIEAFIKMMANSNLEPNKKLTKKIVEKEKEEMDYCEVDAETVDNFCKSSCFKTMAKSFDVDDCYRVIKMEGELKLLPLETTGDELEEILGGCLRYPQWKNICGKTTVLYKIKH